MQMKVKEQFLQAYEGFAISDFDVVVEDCCNLPYFFTTHVFRKVDVSKTGAVTESNFEVYVLL